LEISNVVLGTMQRKVANRLPKARTLEKAAFGGKSVRARCMFWGTTIKRSGRFFLRETARDSTASATRLELDSIECAISKLIHCLTGNLGCIYKIHPSV